MSSSSSSSPSPSDYHDYLDGGVGGGADAHGRTLHAIASQFARYGILKFGTMSLTFPFETVRLLRQLQYGEGRVFASREEEEMAFSIPPSSYAKNQTNSSAHKIADYYNVMPSDMAKLPANVVRDSFGYIDDAKSGQTSEDTQWPLHLNKQLSLWNSVGATARRQGLFSLWNGTFAGWMYEVAMDVGRASVEEALEGSTWVDEQINRFTTHRLHLMDDEASLFTEDVIKPSLVAGLSQGLMGLLLSPVEEVKLRLMAQSIWLPEQKYSSTSDALRSLIRQRGIFGLFRHPLLTLTHHTLGPVLRLLPVSLLNYHFATMATGETSTAWAMALVALQNITMSLPLLVTLPIETVRRRLLLQDQYLNQDLNQNPNQDQQIDPKPYITRVTHWKTLYSGFFNCLFRMVREEGLASLYQGWGFLLLSNTLNFITAILSQLGEDSFDEDDLEEF